MTEKKYIIALDQGTTSSRCLIFNRAGRVVSSAQREFKQIYPKPGWVEHDPQDILSSQFGVVAGALMRGGVSAQDISALGITNQRETVFVWERESGRPVYNAIVWQCRRTAEFCDNLIKNGDDKLIYDKTGLVCDAYFSASKIRWILDNVPMAREKAEAGKLAFGTADTFLIWHLTKGRVHATDYTNASRTMLFNIHTLEWDGELLKLFNIPKAMLPAVYPSAHRYGNTAADIFGDAFPICGVAGDQQAALFGQFCFNEGDIKNTYGTGCFLLMNTGGTAVKSKSGLITTLTAHTAPAAPRYALEGSVFVGGAVIQWLRDGLGLIAAAADSEPLAASVGSTGGVYIVPSFVGLGAPYWDSAARGVITGITRGTGRAHIVRAALEAIAYQSADVILAMQKDSGSKITAVCADGGASANNFLMQFQADITGVKVRRPAVVETTAFGASCLAGLASGFWRDISELTSSVQGYKEFVPLMTDGKRSALLKGWAAAVKKARL